MAAPAPNPYALDDKSCPGGPDRPHQKKPPLTEAEKHEKVAGYVSVPKDLWPFVTYGTHVRYTESAEKGGEFRPGGFILKNPFDTKVRGGSAEKRFFKLQSSKFKTDRSRQEWITAYEDVEFLYAKGSAVELTLQRDVQSVVTGLNTQISRLAEYVKKLERRVAELERGNH